jgi:uncharacterized protein (UPF0262 family)
MRGATFSHETDDRSIVTTGTVSTIWFQRNVLLDIRIHVPTWSAAPAERRRERSLLIAELLEKHPPDEGHGLRLVITPIEGKGTSLGFEGLDGGPSSEIRLAPEVLEPHYREYCDICHRMWMLDEGSHSARLEALDMAKKVAHDRAARVLTQICAPLFADHATARCLFSLLVSLHFDTTLMTRGHRVI